MNILAFECANFSLSIAVQNCNKKRALRVLNEIRGQDSKLLPLIFETLEEVDLDLEKINLITTTVGPGSFTGIRVGLSLARGFRLALNIPLITFNCFDWVFEAILEKQKYEEIFIVLNSQRDELFVKKYTLETHYPPQLLKSSEIVDLLTSKPTLIIGDGAIFIQDYILNKSNISLITEMPNAEQLIEMFFKQSHLDFVSSDEPFYLRLPDITYPKKSDV